LDPEKRKKYFEEEIDSPTQRSPSLAVDKNQQQQQQAKKSLPKLSVKKSAAPAPLAVTGGERGLEKRSSRLTKCHVQAAPAGKSAPNTPAGRSLASPLRSNNPRRKLESGVTPKAPTSDAEFPGPESEPKKVAKKPRKAQTKARLKPARPQEADRQTGASPLL